MKLFALLFILVFAATSCLKKEGCTDDEALNHDFAAETDDNSCVYLATGIIYWDQSAYNYIISDSGSVTLYAYIDGQLVGSRAADEWATSAPNCYISEYISFTDTILYPSGYRHLLVKDEQDHIFCNYVIPFEAGCNLIEILD